MNLLTIHDVLKLAGLKNPGTIYAQIRKGNLSATKHARTDGGLMEWRVCSDEAKRFAAWVKSTPRFQR